MPNGSFPYYLMFVCLQVVSHKGVIETHCPSRYRYVGRSDGEKIMSATSLSLHMPLVPRRHHVLRRPHIAPAAPVVVRRGLRVWSDKQTLGRPVRSYYHVLSHCFHRGERVIWGDEQPLLKHLTISPSHWPFLPPDLLFCPCPILSSYRECGHQIILQTEV